MTAEVHSLGAYRELSGRPSVDTELAAIREKLNIEPPPPIPFRSRLAARLEKAWERLYPSGISQEALREKYEVQLSVTVAEVVQELGLETAHQMVAARLRAIEATERAGF
jgi:hypothetical protein